LISIALKFSPTFVPTSDQFGLASQPAAFPDECDLAEKALRRVSRRKDADKILAEDPGLLESMVAATIVLLEEARYDGDAFRNWIREN
jgi:hypothetical protein